MFELFKVIVLLPVVAPLVRLHPTDVYPGFAVIAGAVTLQLVAWAFPLYVAAIVHLLLASVLAPILDIFEPFSYELTV